MEDLIQALKILQKYNNSKYPTCCEHDTFSVCDIKKENVSDDDIKRLKELSFFWNEEYEAFSSFRFGSC